MGDVGMICMCSNYNYNTLAILAVSHYSQLQQLPGMGELKRRKGDLIHVTEF